MGLLGFYVYLTGVRLIDGMNFGTGRTGLRYRVQVVAAYIDGVYARGDFQCAVGGHEYANGKQVRLGEGLEIGAKRGVDEGCDGFVGTD